MTPSGKLPAWSLITPPLAWAALGGAGVLGAGGWYALPLTIALFAGVIAAVFHAEVVAHKLGEPFGTLVLAISVTAIEVALIVSLMLAGGEATAALARDTVFAAIMVILTGIIGVCLLVGGVRHGEQSFSVRGANTALTTLAALSVLTLILPNVTTSVAGPYYTPSQLGFIAIVSLVLYGTFVLVQTIRHRDYFLPEDAGNEDCHAAKPSNKVTWISLGALLVSLVAVVLLAKALAPAAEKALAAMGAPPALLGIVIAIVVLLPEGLAAVMAARANRVQTSVNLALGSALCSIGLTIPVVATLSIIAGWNLSLGLDEKSTTLLVLSLFVTTISLATGRTTIMQGMVHLVIFLVYLFTTIVP